MYFVVEISLGNQAISHAIFKFASYSPPSAHHLSLLACIMHLQTHMHT